MTEDNRISKVEILLQQNKITEAEKILSGLLKEEPNNIHFLSLFAEVKIQQNDSESANRVINNAIGLSPDVAYLFYVKSRISLHQDNYSEAQENINQAIELDPYDADYFAFLSSIQLSRKQFNEALETADRALEIDAENLLALNTRSTALNKLNRSEESFDTIEGALREDPNNAYTHANYGWGLLEKGDHKKALEHFKEALAQDPTFEYAQVGMLEALKASNPTYRLFLKYSFWMGNMTAKYQWGVLIGFYFGFKGLRSLARNNEALQPFLNPLLILLTIIAFSTWLMTPISNLFLRFNKYGQLLLSKKEKMSSNFVAISLIVCIVGASLYIALSDDRFLPIGAFGFAMMLPLGTMFSPSRNKYALLIYTIALVVVGLVAIGLTFSTGEVFNSMAVVFAFGFILFQWVANFMMIKEDNR